MTKIIHCKSALLFSLLMLFPLFCGAAEAEFFIYPETVHPNEAAYLVIRTEGKKPDTKKLPEVKNLRWIRNSVRTSSNVSIINGKMTSRYENHIPFIVSKKGKYVIPLKGFLNGLTSPQKEITFEAEERVLRSASEREKAAAATSGDGKKSEKKESITLEEAIFSDMVIPGKEKKYYVGEEIPLEVNLYILQNLNGRPIAYPQIIFGENNGAVFRDYSKVNAENPNFERVSRSVKKVGKFTYSVLTFHTRFTPIIPGVMQIRSTLPAILIVQDQRRNTARHSSFFDDDDDFFGSFFNQGRRIERNLPSVLRLDVLKQPPVPQNAFFTGLTGSWKGEASLSPPPYKVGEPVNLKIRYTGKGSLDFLKAPVLSLDGFRCYPPEVEKGINSAEIRYILIPVKEAEGKEENLRLPALAVLDPATGKYDLMQFARKLTVAKGAKLLPDDRKTAVVDASSGKEQASDPEKDEARQHADDVLYLKDLSKDDPITLPLWKNRIIPCMILILAGLLVLAVSSGIAILKRCRENDPLFARRKQANALRKTLLHTLEKLPAEELCTHSGRIAEVLAGLTGLPPGADLKECASFIEKEDEDFARQLEKIASAAWMPSAKASLDEKFRKSFLKKFSSFTTLLLFSCILFLAPDLSGQEKKAVPAPVKVTTAGEAAKAYDAGKFTEAEEFYRKKLKKGHYSANILYNLGNTLYRQGELADALVCYEQALRLAPGDSDIMENLNLVRRKLSLPEKGRIDSPADILPVLRDHIRPDNWLFAASMGFFLLCLGLAAGILYGKENPFRYIFSSAGLIILLVSCCAFFSQQNSSYSGKSVIVTDENVQAYSLPSKSSTPLSLKFRNGEELSAKERREHFIRVRSGNAEGWIPVKSVRFLQVDVNKRK